MYLASIKGSLTARTSILYHLYWPQFAEPTSQSGRNLQTEQKYTIVTKDYSQIIKLKVKLQWCGNDIVSLIYSRKLILVQSTSLQASTSLHRCLLICNCVAVALTGSMLLALQSTSNIWHLMILYQKWNICSEIIKMNLMCRTIWNLGFLKLVHNFLIKIYSGQKLLF